MYLLLAFLQICTAAATPLRILICNLRPSLLLVETTKDASAHPPTLISLSAWRKWAPCLVSPGADSSSRLGGSIATVSLLLATR